MSEETPETSESHNGGSSKQGLALAVAIWGIVALSVIYWFKYGQIPELVSNRGQLDSLYHAILIVTGVVYVVVQVLLGYFIFRYQDKPDAEGSYWHDSHKLEYAWTIATIVILIPFVLTGLNYWGQVKASPVPDDAVVVTAVGAQFQWDFIYPGPDGEFGTITPQLYSLQNPLAIDPTDPNSSDDFAFTNQLVLPVDRPALILLRSKDVQHAFFLPNFRVKQDLVPGMTTQTWFIPTKVGNYEIACAELCGLGHYRMRAFLEIKSQEDYDAWWREQTAPPPVEAPAEVEADANPAAN